MLSTENSITLIIGPMFSSKTTELIRLSTIYNSLNMKVLYVNTKLDTRTNTDHSTHNESISTILPFDSLKTTKLNNIINNIDYFDVIVIDEAHLFTDLVEFCKIICDEKKKIVLCAGLNSDFQRKPFQNIIDLMMISDKIISLNSYCMSCMNKYKKLNIANFSKRISSDIETILIGGKNQYEPSCRNCFLI